MQTKRAGVVRTAIVCAIAFECMTVVDTQFRSVRAHSPWREDPFHTVVSFAQFVVPVLGLLLVARLAARWSDRTPATGTGDAEHQLLRAALALTGIIDATVAVEWASVLLCAHRADWNGVTGWLVGGTALVSVSAGIVTILLLRAGAVRRQRRPWTEDWLEDFARLLGHVPVVRRTDLQRCVAAIRRHAMLVFTAISAVGAILVIGALAVGEGWTDPWLIGWALVVETTSNFVACIVVNAVAGLVARPGAHGRIETAITAGCVGIQLAVAFHDQIWTLFTGHSPEHIGALIVLTLGSAFVVGALTYVARVPDKYQKPGTVG